MTNYNIQQTLVYIYFFLVFFLVLRDRKYFTASGNVFLRFYFWGQMVFRGNGWRSVFANRV